MPNILFSIQLKLGQNILDLEINQNDTIKTLVERLCREKKTQNKNNLEAKIINSLTKIKDMPSTQMPLRMKISKFLDKAQKNQQESDKIKFNSKSYLKSEKQDQENRSAFKSNEKVLPASRKVRFSTIQQQSSGYSRSKLQPDVEICSTDDEDLIRAYNVVLAKSNNTQIKKLVQKTLSQLNRRSFKKQDVKSSQPMRTQINPEQHSINHYKAKYLYNPVRKSVHLMSADKKFSMNRSTQRIRTQMFQERERVDNNAHFGKSIDNTSKHYKINRAQPEQYPTRNQIVKSKSPLVQPKKYNYLTQDL